MLSPVIGEIKYSSEGAAGAFLLAENIMEIYISGGDYFAEVQKTCLIIINP